jgi:hypothetical protein
MPCTTAGSPLIPELVALKGPSGGLGGLMAREQSPLAARPAPAHPQYVRSIIISNPNPELKPQPKPEPNPEPKPEPNPKSRP